MEFKVLDILLAPLCCNRNHYFKVRIQGRTYRFCTRSVPMLFGAIASAGIIIRSSFLQSNGNTVALAGVLLALPDLIYWALTRLRIVPDQNLIRISTGFLLGVGIMLFGQATIAIGTKLAIPLVIFLLMIWAD